MKIYNEKGITLIALVITVILMLILAGVAISALTGDGGLFDKSLKSAEAYEDASQKEKKQIDDLMNEIDGYIGDLTADKKAPSIARLEVSNVTDTSFTLTATGKDNVGIAKYEFYIKNSDGSFTLEKTIETEDTTITYDVTGKDLTQNSYTYKLKVYDKAGNSKESSELLIEAVDNNAPTVATLAVSDMTENGFTLTATAEDDRGIVKYEFYLKNEDGTFSLERTMEVKENTAVYNVTGKNPLQNSYEYKVRVYDQAGNSRESEIVVVGVRKASEVVAVGNYVDYDAGVWTQEDFDKITSSAGSPTLHSTVNDTTIGNQTVPTVQGQFGGFELGQSRNTNSKGNSGYPKSAGWRVWDVDSNTGIVRLVSAGHPETYYNAYKMIAAGQNILKNRDYTMYLNDYATEANILTGEELVKWYNTQYGTNYTIVDNGKNTSSTFHDKTFATDERISVLDIGKHYWLVNAYDSLNMYKYSSIRRSVSIDSIYNIGIRILVSLKADVLLDQSSGDGTVENPWKLAQ